MRKLCEKKNISSILQSVPIKLLKKYVKLLLQNFILEKFSTQPSWTRKIQIFYRQHKGVYRNKSGGEGGGEIWTKRKILTDNSKHLASAFLEIRQQCKILYTYRAYSPITLHVLYFKLSFKQNQQKKRIVSKNFIILLCQ